MSQQQQTVEKDAHGWPVLRGPKGQLPRKEGKRVFPVGFGGGLGAQMDRDARSRQAEALTVWERHDDPLAR